MNNNKKRRRIAFIVVVSIVHIISILSLNSVSDDCIQSLSSFLNKNGKTPRTGLISELPIIELILTQFREPSDQNDPV